MTEYCWKKIGNHRCLLEKKHKGPCAIRHLAQEPPFDRLLRILELSAQGVAHLWSYIWTYSNAGWMTWMVDNGYLTEEIRREEGTYQYGGFSWSGLAPYNRITEKGRELLKFHAPAEW